MSRGSPCPVEIQTWEVMERQRDLLSAIHRLRRSLKACRRCDARTGCEILARFNAQMKQAVKEVAEELQQKK